MVVAKPVDVVWGRGSGKVQCCDWDKTPPRVDVWDDWIWKPGDETVKLEWMDVAVGRFGARLGSDISISVSSWTSSSPIKVESKGSPPFSLFHLKAMYQNEALVGHLLTTCIPVDSPIKWWVWQVVMNSCLIDTHAPGLIGWQSLLHSILRPMDSRVLRQLYPNLLATAIKCTTKRQIFGWIGGSGGIYSLFDFWALAHTCVERTTLVFRILRLPFELVYHSWWLPKPIPNLPVSMKLPLHWKVAPVQSFLCGQSYTMSEKFKIGKSHDVNNKDM